MIKPLIFIITIILTLNLSFSTENIKLYLDEFSNAGETCSSIHAFTYISSKQKITEAVTYACCDSKDKCDFIIFDTDNLKPFGMYDLEELFTLDRIQQRLRDDEINKNLYSVDDGFSSCEYIGYETKLSKENKKLFEFTLKSVESYLPENSKKMAKTVMKVGRTVGTIKKFNPGDFAVGVSCKLLVDEEAKTFETLALCHNFLNNINNNNVYYGLSQDLTNCNTEVLVQLKSTLESTIFQIKNVFDIVFSGLSTIKEIISNPLNEGNYKTPEKTRQDIFKELKVKLENNDVDFEYRKAYSLADASFNRINDKYNLTLNTYNLEKIMFSNIQMKSDFELSIINFIYEPNLN
ncbi:MAG: hypothetical protein HRU03_09460, partial [Nanoarchaeales archaeon]|nr:hypothetical protein [Nanoarchaeales archaeon]